MSESTLNDKKYTSNDIFTNISVIAHMADDKYVYTVKRRFQVAKNLSLFFTIVGSFVSFMIGWWMLLYHVCVMAAIVSVIIYAEHIVIKLYRVLALTSHKLEDGLTRTKL